jgi:GTPase
LLDISDRERDPWRDYQVINNELNRFDTALLTRPQITVITKLDLPDTRARFHEVQVLFSDHGVELMAVSAVTGEGVKELVQHIAQTLERHTEETLAQQDKQGSNPFSIQSAS